MNLNQEKNFKKNKKNKVIIISLIVLLVIGLIGLFLVLFKPFDKKPKNDKKKVVKKVEKKTNGEKVDIIDVNSKTRPIAVVINNTPIAVKVQEGLSKAYLVYEIPTEGYTSRLLAFYKDVPDTKIGTIRSARHNFFDFAYESDAIFVAYGWSHYAEDQLKNGVIDYVQGIASEGDMFRENPEGLAWEHRVYATTGKIFEYAHNVKKYNKESNNTILLKYNVSDIDLSKKEGVITANKVSVPYGDNESEFTYDSNTKLYTKSTDGTVNKDHDSGEVITTKNIIVEKISYQMADDNHYWDLNTVGSGDGYYITNGMAVPIKWSKENRKAKTKYTYLDGKEIEVSDGRTYIEVQITDKNLIIE